ncbi:hypothetical protein RvVAT039_20420 [Agrobacterium vitis]|nr:hypothetical protein RvVAT039_20420 [Agrobacterium vitis]
MPIQDRVEQRPELDRTATHIQTIDLEGYDPVVTGKAELAQRAQFVCHGTTPGTNASLDECRATPCIYRTALQSKMTA